MKPKEIIRGKQVLTVVIGEEHFEHPDTDTICITGMDWNSDLSPWPCKKVFAKGQDFGGGADITIEKILDALAGYPLDQWKYKIIAGYSLAGLFAIYTCTKTDLFDGCVSSSGSLWYPDFVTYVDKNPLCCNEIVLSLGDREKDTKNQLLASVEEKTDRLYQLCATRMRAQRITHPGNHFDQPEKRLTTDISACMHLAEIG